MKGVTEDKMVGWHDWFTGHQFEQALEDGEGQGSLEWCMQSMGSQRVGHNLTTEQDCSVSNEHTTLVHKINFNKSLIP